MAIASQQNIVESTGVGPDPQIHPSASVTGSVIGRYTDIGSNWTVTESRLGDYSYLAGSDGTVIHVWMVAPRHISDLLAKLHHAVIRRCPAFATAHIGINYAALSKMPRALADGLMLASQKPAAG